MVEMTGLRTLHASMRQLGVEVQQFRFQTGAVEFDCLFSDRERPYLLTLTSRGANPEFFSFDVEKGYKLPDFIVGQYGRLVALLHTHGLSGVRFSPKNFFNDLNQAVPKQASANATPTPADIVRLRHDLPERDRPYFDRWEQRGKGPSDKNLAKTLAMLGQEAKDFSKNQNKSSIWSSNPSHEQNRWDMY